MRLKFKIRKTPKTWKILRGRKTSKTWRRLRGRKTSRTWQRPRVSWYFSPNIKRCSYTSIALLFHWSEKRIMTHFKSFMTLIDSVGRSVRPPIPANHSGQGTGSLLLEPSLCNFWDPKFNHVTPKLMTHFQRKKSRQFKKVWRKLYFLVETIVVEIMLVKFEVSWTSCFHLFS